MMIQHLYRLFSLMFFLILFGCEANTINIESLPNSITQQHLLEQNWIKDFEDGDYTIENPYLLHDPYQNSPLSYLLMFETEKEATISYEVIGHSEKTSFTYKTSTPTKKHQLILTGLYANEENTIHLKATLTDGTILTHTLKLQTPSLPNHAISPNVTQPKNSNEQTALYLISDDYYHYLVDELGEIRWIQTSSSGSVTPLSTGTLLTYSDPLFYYYHQSLIERNYLGQTLKKLYIPGAGHHSLVETESGDYLINSSDKSNERYIEDIIYLLDSETGEILEDVNLRDYLDVSRFEQTLPAAVKGDYNDWFHLNYAMIDSSDNTIIASGRSQSMVIKLNPKTQTLKWILGAPDEVNEELQPYLLTPIGQPFNWPFAQHSSKVLPDIDHNKETTDIILFDNHVDIGVFSRTLYPDLNQFSRAVHYRTNENNMTIEQLWSFGEELSPTLFSTIISEVDYLAKDNKMLVLFGFIQQNNLTGGKLFEVDATNPSNITFEMELLKEGANRIYTVERLEMKDLNLTVQFDSPQVILGTENLNLQRLSSSDITYSKQKTFDSDAINSIQLTDTVLFIDAYIKKTKIEDPLSLVLTDDNGLIKSFSISPTDCYPVSADEKIPSLSSKNKKVQKKGNLYQIIDRIDLSSLPAGHYQLSFLMNETLYQTTYELTIH